MSLEDLGFDIDELERRSSASRSWRSASTRASTTACPTNINLKSMVWYPKDDFDAAGYEVPDHLGRAHRAERPDRRRRQHAVVRRLRERGRHRLAGHRLDGGHHAPHRGPDVYDQWVAHEIPFNDPAVKAAARAFGEILFTEGYVLGGAAATADIAFGDAPGPMFDDPPKCWLHRQASFINSFFPEDAVAGVDYDWFPCPPIDQEGILYAGELTVVGKNGNRPEVVDFLERFIGRGGPVRDGRRRRPRPASRRT